MKTIFLFLIILSGAMAKAQHANSQASQVITLRLQPISFIDFSAAESSKSAKQADAKNDPAASSSMRDIIVNKNLSAQAALPAEAASTLQDEQKNSSRNMMAYSDNQHQSVYTFSSR
ncbi:MAG: hypothetical protein INR73_17120 [Williamsia sp.]|nr:hypothetical protein [Williamsia sp.]